MYKEVIKEASEKLNLPYDYVDKVYRGFWLFIKDKIKSWPIQEYWTEDEYKELRTSINIPSIGKLGLSWKDYYNKKKQIQVLRDRKHESK